MPVYSRGYNCHATIGYSRREVSVVLYCILVRVECLRLFSVRLVSDLFSTCCCVQLVQRRIRTARRARTTPAALPYHVPVVLLAILLMVTVARVSEICSLVYGPILVNDTVHGT
jgi:hypothetical protein